MNNNTNNKIAICYRIYPKISKIPPIFADDKYKLSELCLRSFVKSLKGIDAKIWVLLDNCPQIYFSLFDKYLNDFDYELIPLNGIGNAGTFGMQMNLLLNQQFSEYIYFAEDDYFYIEKAFTEMLTFFNNNSADFLTPYDHLDSYERKFHDYKNKIVFSGNQHWRTIGTTTMTFLTKKEILKDTFEVFKTYTKNNFDASLWLSLTKHNVLNPIKMVSDSIRNYEEYKIYIKAFYFCSLQIIFGNKYKLFQPIPSLAVHMDSHHLAPGIDWLKKFDELSDGL
jgi:hypothetical protein